MWSSIKLIALAIGAFALAACNGGQNVEDQGALGSVEKPAASAPPSAARKSLVTEHQIETAFAPAPATFHVYLPPSYDDGADKDYPVIYWLHGSGGYPPGMLQGLAGRFHTAIQQGKMPEAIIVFPDGFVQSNWVNSYDNTLRMEDILIKELIPRIDTDYRTISTKKGRVVEGGSMGGYGTARLGFKFPELFAGISMLNPGPMQRVMNIDEAPIVGREGARRIFEDVYGGDQDYFQAQSPWRLAEENKDRIAGALTVRMIIGGKDPTVAVNQAFSEHLTDLGIDHEFVLLTDAGHNPREMFGALGEEYWAFFVGLLSD